ncbi:MAG: hypothetical protein KBT15_03005 [Bacteroidales bacterium]|nr:hypothetical protein [Candidatus Minthousia equi]
MMHKKIVICGLVLTALSFSSCSEYSLMDDEAIRMGLFGEEYSENFENAYGKIAPDQTWDFSTINLRNLGLYGGPSSSTAATRAAYTGSVNATPATEPIIKETKTEGISISNYGDYYAVEQGTLEWLNTHLPEGVQEPLNVTKGSPFVLGTPTNDFAIIPIYQGHAGMCWDLHLVDKTTNKDYTIWSKSDGIRYKIDYDGENVIGVAGHEIQYWDEVWVESTNYGRQQKRIPIGYIFKGYDESFGDLVLSCSLPSGANINGRIMDVSYPGGTETFGDINFKNGDDALVFSGTQTYTIPAATAKKMKENADNLYFEIWWNDGWNGGTSCYFGSLQSDQYRTEFKITTANKSSGNHTGWLYLDGMYSNEIAHTVNRQNVQAKPILIDHSKISGDFFLYLKITQQDPDNPAYAAEGACQRSDEGMMVALPLTRPENIASDKEYMIIGCEDSNTEISDWDVNDICFLIVGQGTLPKVKEVVAKRYMIEDLGSTYDFDFNDIVVDVTQTTEKNYDGTEYSKVQTAEIKWLCGTIPFQLKIGDTTFDKLEGHVSTYPSTVYPVEQYKKTITGWNPATNNIIVTTWPKAAGTEWDDKDGSNFLGEKDSHTFSFPENGEFPYIIACDQTVNWMAEQVSVPRSWFNTWPANYDNWPNHSQDTPQQGGGTSIFTYSGYPSDYTATYENESGNFVKINLGTALQNKDVTKVEIQSATAINGAFGCSYNEWKETAVTVDAGETKEITLSSEILEQINAGGDLFLQIYQDPSGFNFNGLKITIDKK